MAKRKAKGTPISAKDLPILAAIFARSNMGQGLPTAAEVARLRDSDKPTTLESAVVYYCQQFMESDEHEKGFIAEGKMWMRELKRDTRERICAVHKDIGRLYWPPVA